MCSVCSRNLISRNSEIDVYKNVEDALYFTDDVSDDTVAAHRYCQYLYINFYEIQAPVISGMPEYAQAYRKGKFKNDGVLCLPYNIRHLRQRCHTAHYVVRTFIRPLWNMGATSVHLGEVSGK